MVPSDDIAAATDPIVSTSDADEAVDANELIESVVDANEPVESVVDANEPNKSAIDANGHEESAVGTNEADEANEFNHHLTPQPSSPRSAQVYPPVAPTMLTPSTQQNNESLHIYSPLGSPADQTFRLSPPVGPSGSYFYRMMQKVQALTPLSPTRIPQDQARRRYSELEIKAQTDPSSSSPASGTAAWLPAATMPRLGSAFSSIVPATQLVIPMSLFTVLTLYLISLQNRFVMGTFTIPPSTEDAPSMDSPLAASAGSYIEVFLL